MLLTWILERQKKSLTHLFEIRHYSSTPNVDRVVSPNSNVCVIVPISLRKTVQGRVITVAENVRTVQNQTPLLAAIGCGILWQQWLDEGLFANVSELAKHLGKDRSFVSHMLQLALLSPEIIHLAIIGALPDHISLATLRVGLPADWEEQKKVFGIE